MNATQTRVLHDIRFYARIVSDHMRKSPGGDKYEFVGSTNMVDDLAGALSEYDDVTDGDGE